MVFKREALGERQFGSFSKQRGYPSGETLGVKGKLAKVAGAAAGGGSLSADIGFDALAAFFDRIVREANDIEIVHPCGTDFHQIGVDAKDSGAEGLEEHERETALCAAQG